MSDVKRRVCHACVSFPRDAFCNVCDPDQSELAVLHGLCEDRFNELAALREELDRMTCDRDFNLDGKQFQSDIADKFQLRLTAAEQRNAELIQLMSEVIPYEAYLGSKLFKRISAALKPADPVQAVCTSCDGSGEYIDAIGDWRGYCSCPTGVALKNKPTESGASA